MGNYEIGPNCLPQGRHYITKGQKILEFDRGLSFIITVYYTKQSLHCKYHGLLSASTSVRQRNQTFHFV